MRGKNADMARAFAICSQIYCCVFRLNLKYCTKSKYLKNTNIHKIVHTVCHRLCRYTYLHKIVILYVTGCVDIFAVVGKCESLIILRKLAEAECTFSNLS
jgi:hypothetical protein